MDARVRSRAVQRRSSGASPPRTTAGWAWACTSPPRSCEAHGGAISVGSTPGQGSTFTVELPRRAAASRLTRAAGPFDRLRGTRPLPGDARTHRLRGQEVRDGCDGREPSAAGVCSRGGALEEVGPLPQRAAVGHGARGLQPGRRRLGLTSPHDQARSRAYRWGEDGLGGICDDKQRLCFALALWNGRDPILKERLFGLTNGEGNHGEDVKEYYFYLDSTPTHSYMKFLYKYPQAAFPYDDLVADQPPAQPRGAGVRAAGHRACSTRTATSTSSSSTPRRRPRTS